MKNFAHLLIAALACALRLEAADPTVAEVLQEWTQGGGFAIVVGATDAGFLSGLTNGGRMMVHGLCADDVARDRLRLQLTGQGIYGLASVALWEEQPRLPYASRLGDIIVADLDALGAKAPGMAEFERALAPDGVLYLRSKGAWKALRPKRPAGLDDWGHFDHGADGNPLSQDTVTGPVRQQQWVADSMPFPLQGNPAGYDPGCGLRIAGRYAILDINDAGPFAEEKGKVQKWALQARDAWNGTPLWTVPRDARVARKRWSLVADGNDIFTYLAPGADLVALDVTSGKTLRSFPGTAPQQADGKAGTAGPEGETASIRATGDALLVTVNGIVRCFDRASGKPRWSFSREGQMVLGPVVDMERKRLYGLLAKRQDGRNFEGRWPFSKTVTALIAMDLATGKIAWECTGVGSEEITSTVKGTERKIRRSPGQIVICGDKVVVFGSAAISGGEGPYIGTVDSAQGKLLFSDDAPFKKDYNVASYNALVRDGAVWFAGAFTNLWRYDPATGKTEKSLTYGWNQRCTRMTATPNWLLFGQSAWYGKDLTGEQIPVARSGCALGNIPANGMTYFTPNACHCIIMVRGFHAMTGEPLAAPVADAERVVKGGKPIAPISSPADKLPDGPIAQDWRKTPLLVAATTPPVTAGDLQIVAVVQQHRIEARRGNALIWTAMADARISGAALVIGDTVLYGAHDGCVYGIALRDGTPRFRVLIAPSRRFVVANGQLESAWPVYGLAMMDGKVVASAGTHPATGGGVAVAALDPQTGATAWRTMLEQLPNAVLAGGGKGTRIADRSFLNSVPVIADGRITLGGTNRVTGSFSFTPGETAESLSSRLTNPEPGKKK